MTNKFSENGYIIVRKAISEQARALEEHLTAIHNRLVELERKPR